MIILFCNAMSIIIIPIKVALQRTYLNGMDDLAIVVSCGVCNEFLCAMEDLHMAMDRNWQHHSSITISAANGAFLARPILQ